MSEYDYGSMSAESAQTQIDEIMCDKDSPYHGPANALGREAVMSHLHELYKVKCPEPSPGSAAPAREVSPEFTAVMKDAVQEQAVRDEDKKTQLRRDMRTEIESVNASMEGSNIDVDAELKDPTLEKLQGYKMMACLGRGDFKTLTPLILDDCRCLGMAAEKVEQVQTFLLGAEPGDPLSDDIVNLLIRHTYKAKKGKQ